MTSNQNEAPSLEAAVGYARTSGPGQKDNTSIKDQLKRIQSHADARGLRLHAVMFDDGVSGASLQRAALWDAVQMLRCVSCQPRKMPDKVTAPDWDQPCLCGMNKGVNTLIVWDFKRFGRNSTETIFLCLEVLDKLGKRLIIVDGDIQVDTSTPMGRFMLKLFANMAELDKDELKDKMKRGKDFIRLNSVKFAEGGVPYGFKTDRSHKSGSNLLPNLDITDPTKGEYATLKLIFLYHAMGASYREIVYALNANKIPARRGGNWKLNQVWRVLNESGLRYPQVIAHLEAIKKEAAIQAPKILAQREATKEERRAQREWDAVWEQA